MLPALPTNEVATAVLESLQLAILERQQDGSFRLLGRAPAWFQDLLPSGLETETIHLTELFPFLEFFLDEALESIGLTGRAQSDIWTERDSRGSDRQMQAVAMQVSGSLVLIIESPSEAQQERTLALQRSHDVQLQAERIERMRRQLAKLNEELKVRNEEVLQATKAKSEFLAAMSHEIRTPMNAIIGMADLLQLTPLNAEQKRYVQVFQSAGENLLALINDILDLSKVEAGKIELESVEFSLTEVIESVIDIAQVRAKKKGLTLTKTIDANVATLLIGDPNRLRQVLLNLVGNSIKFTEAGGIRVHVAPDTADLSNGVLHFLVEDTGIGIPKDKLGTIFESFSQADSSTTRKYGGTGLGLSISRQLISLMGGSVWVESEVGVGSKFHFTAKFSPHLKPIPSEAAVSEGRLFAVESHGGPQGKKSIDGLRILLADDSEDNRFLIVSYLKGSGCILDIAENGRIAVEKFEAGAYDLVLMDVEMPEMDGYAAVRAIRQGQRESGRTTPVLALTAHAFRQAVEKSFKAGFTDHLTKPIRRTTLLEAIHKYAPVTNAFVKAVDPVAVDPLLSDLIPGFLEKRRLDVTKLAQALATGDYETIRKLGHNLKGTGAGYGFASISEIGSKIEEAAKLQDAVGIRESLEALVEYLGSVTWTTASSSMGE